MIGVLQEAQLTIVDAPNAANSPVLRIERRLDAR